MDLNLRKKCDMFHYNRIRLGTETLKTLVMTNIHT